MQDLSSDAAVLSAIRRLDAAAPGEGRSLAEIAQVAGLGAGSARSALMRLTLRGSIGRAAGGRFALHHHARRAAIVEPY